MAKQTFTIGQVLTAAEMTSLQQTAMGGGSTTDKTASYTLVAADAGTVVQMNSGSSTTITVNTALFSAGDSVQIQNVGAGVCTVTAGSATVSTAGSLALSQYEGGQLYFNTTSAALFFDIVQTSGMANPLTTTGDIIYSSSGTTAARLGIGSSAQVLSVSSGLPAWATPAGGGMVKITRQTFSNVASTTTLFDGVFSSSYYNYIIAVEKITAGTGSDDLQFQFRYGSTTYSSVYYSALWFVDYLNTSGGSGGNGDAAIRLSQDTGTGNNFTSGNIYPTQVGNGAAQSQITWLLQSASSGKMNVGSGNLDSGTTNNYTGFILKSSSSNITGSVTVYGLPQ